MGSLAAADLLRGGVLFVVGFFIADFIGELTHCR
jgi:hypothetical protein